MKLFVWEESARDELRDIERRQALGILHALTRLARGEDIGQVKKLTEDPQDCYRLRIGDWRVLFKYEEGGVIHIYAVGNRKDIYRR